MKPPLQIAIAMTPAKFAELHARLENGNPHAFPGDLKGHLDEADVSFDWSYNGTDTVSLTITAVHSLKARLASAAQVESGIRAMVLSS